MWIECQQSLPQPYRWQEFLAFHGRDAQQRSELLQVSEQRLFKALIWQGQPALLVLQWNQEKVQARLHVPDAVAQDMASSQQELQAMLQRMLGLAYPPSALLQAHGSHPELGPLLARQAGLHVPASPTPFEALSWAIMGQQISVAVAVSLRRKLIEAAGLRLHEQTQKLQPEAAHLLAYPDAVQVLTLDVEQLRALSFSQAKAQTLRSVAKAVVDGVLPLDEWASQSAQEKWSATAVEAVAGQLLAIKGIGPWTVNYCLLRGYGWPDGSLHGDVAVRRAIGLLQQKEKPDALAASIWLDQFQPFRALVAAHLWASLSSQAY
ncbi:DNA-3-methyladenine glycosylase family protein [Comamonas fluminis]|uniref:DNA-3-methyladenine glycosylase family protein n=1 Tax=Comamonas fluminis TaxID=2796366 RepID=UPI001C4728C9|nr:DNA repair protein [Comamonas fluminis]